MFGPAIERGAFLRLVFLVIVCGGYAGAESRPMIENGFDNVRLNFNAALLAGFASVGSEGTS
jgi:hypothetical protein